MALARGGGAVLLAEGTLQEQLLLVTEQTIALVIRRVGGLEDYGTMGL